MELRTARIIYPATGIGLVNDARILAGTLRRLGVQVSVTPLPVHYAGSRALRAAGRVARVIAPRRAAGLYRGVASCSRAFAHTFAGGTVDLAIYLQRVFHTLTPHARRNVLIPNPEWLWPEWRWHLGIVDAVLCKTSHAVDVLTPWARRCEYIGFTSVDRLAAGRVPEHGGWLHLASAGVQKGTTAVLDAWRAHPEWPLLTVVQHANPPLGESSGNVRYIAGRLPEPELMELMNACAVHLCPSEAEGYGHTIVEAMSCGALVLTTDAPPMNELVDESRGVLIPAGPGIPWRHGTRYPVDSADVARAVERVLAMDTAEVDWRRRAARQWYEENDRSFPERLLCAIERL